MYIPQYLLSLRSISSAGPPTQPHSTQELPIQAQQDSLFRRNVSIYIFHKSKYSYSIRKFHEDYEPWIAFL